MQTGLPESWPPGSTSVSATEILRKEIEDNGPISFERFMDVALYHPQHGYYRKDRDPFGQDGDFYTAVQLQPCFGKLIRTILEKLSPLRTLIDIGAGRGEMGEQFQGWNYLPVDIEDTHPLQQPGIIFANELFDALPCRVYDTNGEEALVDFRNNRFVWTSKPVKEECPSLPQMLQRMSEIISSGYLLLIDYGYEERERAFRFPDGTLMSYRRHLAHDDVLLSPGDQDITLHVNFTSVIEYSQPAGFRLIKKCSLASFLMEAGEDTFQELTRSHPQQLKSLLFGMGEAFQVILFERISAETALNIE